MKEADTEENPLRETSRLELVIDTPSIPGEAKIDKIINEIVEHYNLKTTKITVDTCGAKGMHRTRLVIKAVGVGEPTMAALEMFGWMIGNIRIYERVVKYSRA